MASNHDTETRLLSEDDVRTLLDISDVVEAVENTYEGFGRNEVINPAKMDLTLGENGAWPGYEAHITAMPAYVGWIDAAGQKWVGGYWKNAEKGLPTHTALIILISPETGIFEAVVEGGHITAVRTGAQTAVGAKYLQPGATTVGIYGAGVQARWQIRALAETLELETVKVFDLDPEARSVFVEEMGEEMGFDVEPVDSAPEAADADIVVTVTTATEPFIEPEWIDDGTLVAAMGTYQELRDGAVLGMDRVIVDHIEQALNIGVLRKLNDRGKVDESDIDVTIGNVVASDENRTMTDGETVLYVPIGTGALDVATATLAHDRAVDRDVGTTFEFSTYERPN